MFLKVATAILTGMVTAGVIYLFFTGRPVTVPMLGLACANALATGFVLAREFTRKTS